MGLERKAKDAVFGASEIGAGARAYVSLAQALSLPVVESDWVSRIAERELEFQLSSGGSAVEHGTASEPGEL